MTTDWALAALSLITLLAALLIVAGRRLRRGHGLGQGETQALDDRLLVSRRHGLSGRPDRLLREGGHVIPEEWKSSRRLQPSHRAQMGVYFLVMEEELGVRPPYGIVVCGDGKRHRIENAPALRAWVLGLVERIREARGHVEQPIVVMPRRGQCAPCGQRGNCSFALRSCHQASKHRAG